MVLGVRVDWAESFPDVALGRPGGGVIEQFRIEHGPAGVTRLVTRCLELEPDPAEVRVVLETRHGLLVEALVDAGFTVLPVNPDLVARRRGPAKKKDDAEDARICCLLALDAYLDLRKLIPHGQAGAELRAIARDDERAARDERRIGNRLRGPAGRLPRRDRHRRRRPRRPGVPPAAAKLAVRRCARPGQRGRAGSPSPARPGTAGPGKFADRVTSAMAAPRLAVRPELARAKAGAIRLAAAQLLAIRAQRREWERRMGELLLGAPTGRDHTPQDPGPGKAFPGGEIYLSMPGLGDRLAARVAGEIGEHHEQHATPNALQCYAGRAPVARRSGRSEFTVARRLACNRHFGQAVHQWAFCSTSRSAWAREFYDAKTTAGDTHHAALRKLGNRWLEIPGTA
jgi:hypothetical protein